MYISSLKLMPYIEQTYLFCSSAVFNGHHRRNWSNSDMAYSVTWILVLKKYSGTVFLKAVRYYNSFIAVLITLLQTLLMLYFINANHWIRTVDCVRCVQTTAETEVYCTHHSVLFQQICKFDLSILEALQDLIANRLHYHHQTSICTYRLLRYYMF